jgi:serine/threonine protein kinase
VKYEIDRARKDYLMSVLQEEGAFDPNRIFATGQRPPCPSLFTSAIQSLNGLREIGELGYHGIADVCECETSSGSRMQKKRIVLEDNCDVRKVVCFFRELISQLYVDHPAFHQLHGWNISMKESLCELYLFHEISNPQPLKFPMLCKFTRTQKMILLYGIARGMQHLHSLKVVHRDLKMVGILVDSDKYPYIGNFWRAKGDDHRDILLSDYLRPHIHHSPEVMDGKSFTFESDVYSFAIFAYEVLEGHAAVFQGLPTAVDQKRFVWPGGRPAWRTVSADLKRPRDIMEQIWHQNPSCRLMFEQIVDFFERGEFWFPETDSIAFYLYKGYVDALVDFEDRRQSSSRHG